LHSPTDLEKKQGPRALRAVTPFLGTLEWVDLFSVGDEMPAIARSLRFSLSGLLFACSVSVSTMVAAQAPAVPPEFYNPVRPAEGHGIRFCIWPETSTAAFDRAVADEIAGALLLRSSFHEIDIIPGSLTDEEFWHHMFIRLTESCSAMLAAVLSPVTELEDWLTITQPYLSSPFVAISGDETISSLGDLGPRGLLGTTVFSDVDLAVLNYLQTLSADQRWRRLPYEDIGTMLEHLQQGVLTAGLVWQPALVAALPDNLERYGLREISMAPLRTSRRELGVLLRSDDTALRVSLDQAISALWEDGTLVALAEEHGLVNLR